MKLVDYDTSGVEFIDGVQIVNILKPLGASLNGKTIGDRVKVGDTDVEVEIVDIR
jgi:transcription elongation GreA/GreB family factor